MTVRQFKRGEACDSGTRVVDGILNRGTPQVPILLVGVNIRAQPAFDSLVCVLCLPVTLRVVRHGRGYLDSHQPMQLKMHIIPETGVPITDNFHGSTMQTPHLVEVHARDLSS